MAQRHPVSTTCQHLLRVDYHLSCLHNTIPAREVVVVVVVVVHKLLPRWIKHDGIINQWRINTPRIFYGIIHPWVGISPLKDLLLVVVVRILGMWHNS
jgi:hypothetical protein